MEACDDAKSGTCDSDAPNIGAEYEIAIFDRDGNEKRRFGGKANCFVKGFLDYIWHLVRNGGESGVPSPFRDISGTSRNSNLSLPSGMGVGGARANGGSGVITHGIVCGRSTTPVTLSDYQVGDAIGTADLDYATTMVEPPKYDGATATIEISRSIRNVGESTMSDINSIALYARGTGQSWSFMMLRDVIPTVDIDPGESMIVLYRIRFNVGS